ncbi:hypothetical protein K470DRAFT_256191 [Piedraia hortae CBS 480.64]|uniref:Pre-mRNA-splicing factor CWC24 n=1 Tax=Piedraia hortae CBS 480.64 TaxID=1314780 RepID=A0A6A7C3Q9_9PEZI|nr:hypothetical protein K470DRAFT_256191 [Piedraia hortae CBS 480.64]
MADSAPVFKKRGAGKNVRKRAATPPMSPSSSSDVDQAVRVKRPKKVGIHALNEQESHIKDVEKRASTFSADRSTTLALNEESTKVQHWNAEGADPSGRKMGPKKAAGNVRVMTLIDFAPDVCKDYKLTGFCGFGDTCKFLHAREDYKQGWQLDREWEIGEANKTADSRDQEKTEEEKLLENIPFKCIICKDDYKKPIMTKCGHYFCEKCAMTRYAREKTKQCANCGADTGGTFSNVGAKKLNDLLEKKRLRQEAKDALKESDS